MLELRHAPPRFTLRCGRVHKRYGARNRDRVAPSCPSIVPPSSRHLGLYNLKSWTYQQHMYTVLFLSHYGLQIHTVPSSAQPPLHKSIIYQHKLIISKTFIGIFCHSFSIHSFNLLPKQASKCANRPRCVLHHLKIPGFIVQASKRWCQ